MSDAKDHPYRDLGVALYRLGCAVGFAVVLIDALVNFDNTARFGKLLAVLAFWVLLDIADEVRKIRKARGTS